MGQMASVLGGPFSITSIGYDAAFFPYGNQRTATMIACITCVIALCMVFYAIYKIHNTRSHMKDDLDNLSDKVKKAFDWQYYLSWAIIVMAPISLIITTLIAENVQSDNYGTFAMVGGFLPALVTATTLWLFIGEYIVDLMI